MVVNKTFTQEMAVDIKCVYVDQNSLLTFSSYIPNVAP